MKKMSRTWWGEKFLHALTSCMDAGRIQRGRPYSGPNRLLNFEILGHMVNATIRGNINPYFEIYEEPQYKVQVSLVRFSADAWKGIANNISQHAAILSQLMLNEMPAGIEQVFASRNLHLLPKTRSDIISKCSCPDSAFTCKHVAGVYYKIASLLDQDPFLLFQLRGMQFEKLHRILASSDLGQSLIDQQQTETINLQYHAHLYPAPIREPIDCPDLKSFWQGPEPLPKLESVEESPVTPAILIKKGGDLPGFWHHGTPLIEMMEPIYTRIVTKNRHSI